MVIEARVTEVLGCPYKSHHQRKTERMVCGAGAHALRQDFLGLLDFKTEVELRVRINNDFVLVGHIDALYDAEYPPRIYELKTSEKIYHTYKLQTRTYAWMYARLFHKLPLTYIILIGEDGSVRRREEVFEPDLGVVERIVRGRVRMIKYYMHVFDIDYTRVRLPNEFCRYCVFRRSCPVFKTKPRFFKTLDRFPKLSESWVIIEEVGKRGGWFSGCS